MSSKPTIDIDCGIKEDSTNETRKEANKATNWSSASSSTSIDSKSSDKSSYSSRTRDSSRSGSQHSYTDKSVSNKDGSFVKQGGRTGKKTKGKKLLPTIEKKRFSWKNPVSWKRFGYKPQPSKCQHGNMENYSTQRILSARLHTIKRLQNELYDLQRTLESVNVENKVLKRLQYRHVKALEKYESTENNLQQLLTHHNNEVKMLKQLLRNSQEKERYASKKLKDTEGELLRETDNVYRLQKLLEDKSLAERAELSHRLSVLLAKRDEDNDKIKVLEKQLHLTIACYNRQLAAESKKLIEARVEIKKMETEVEALNQKVKEKERELDIKNIYANRMPKDLYKYDHLFYHKGLTLTKSTQTESEMLNLDRTKKHELGDYNLFEEKSKDIEDVTAAINGIEEYLPASQELQRPEDSAILDEQEPTKKPEEDNEILMDNVEKSLNDMIEDDSDKLQSNFQEQYLKGKTHDKARKQRKQYKFTVATKNLHQGFPSMGPLSSANNSSICRNCNPQTETTDLTNFILIDSCQTTFENMEISKQDDMKEKIVKNSENSLKERKQTLMEELFGPKYSLTGHFSDQDISAKQEFLESLQENQAESKNSNMPIDNSNLLPNLHI